MINIPLAGDPSNIFLQIGKQLGTRSASTNIATLLYCTKKPLTKSVANKRISIFSKL
jgi:hypothetical protein